MKLYPLTLNSEQKTGEVDKLGNPIIELSFLYEGEGRKSIWSAQEIALDARIVSKNLQKAITTIQRKTLLTASQVVLNGSKYAIEEIKGEDDDRWRILYLKSYGK